MPASSQSSLRHLVRLLGFTRPYLLILVVAVVSALLYGGGLSGRAYLLRPLVDDVVLPNATLESLDEVIGSAESADPAAAEEERGFLRERVRANFFQVLLAGLLLILVMPLLRLVRDYTTSWIMTRLHVDLQTRMGAKLMRLPLSDHLRGGRGDMIARLGNDTGVANQAQQVIFGDVVQDAAIILAAGAFAFYVSWQLALVMLLVGPPVGLVLQIFGGRIRRSAQARQEQVSQVTQQLIQMLSGIKVIKAFHTEAQEGAAFQASVMRYFRRAMKVVRNRVYSRSLVELVTQASGVAVVLVGVWAIVQGFWDLTLGKLMAFATISAMLYRPTKGAASIYNKIMDALPAAARVFAVLDAPEVSPDRPGAVELERMRRGICYRDVWFTYGREEVLEGVDLEIGPGEAVALVGRSGAGKTTMADLLLRFEEPDRGAIEIDGIDLRDLRRASLHRLIAVVTQEPFLFNDTILENIRYGKPDATREEVVAAATAANAHEFIAELPEGYETDVGELGSQLSGGQRQRITIARAILRDPQILIFDEATSSLDAKAEQHVQAAIATLMRGRTVLLIAHRLSTVKAADRIAILEDGRITMTGTHQDLLGRTGLYRELVELQLGAETPAA